jgi:hypothetical protein
VLVVGAPGSEDGRGAAHVYRRDARTGGGRSSRGSRSRTRETGDRLGSAVALDGDDVWVGAPAPRGTDIGTTYVYRTAAASPCVASS